MDNNYRPDGDGRYNNENAERGSQNANNNNWNANGGAGENGGWNAPYNGSNGGNGGWNAPYNGGSGENGGNWGNNGNWNSYYNGNGGNDNMQGRSSAMGITSMVLGIIAVVMLCCFYYVSIPLGIAAIIFGIVSLKKKEPKKGFAIAGLVAGIFGFIFGVMLTAILVLMIKSGTYQDILNNLYRDIEMDF